MPKISRLPVTGVLTFLLLLLPSPSLHAQTDVENEVGTLEKRIDEQDKVIGAQQDAISQQAEQIREQKQMIDALVAASPKKKPASATQQGMAAQPAQTPSSTVQAAPASPQSPAQQNIEASQQSMTPPTPPSTATELERPQVEALADEGGVLSPKGMLTFETTTEYTNTARNLFTFNGVELAQVVLVGVVNDTTATHNIVQETGRLRLGITNRLEADVHVPYVYRNDSLVTTDPNTNVQIPSTVEGNDLGDIDAGLAYQINDGKQGWPFLIGNLRYKANNANGPYDVSYNANNIANTLPTGTGFQTAEASITAIKITDPAILFANIGYVYDVPRDINRNFNGTYVTSVNPGDAVNALVGMAFAINQDLSFSVGYKHSYVFPTIQNSIDVSSGAYSSTSSGSSQVGTANFGLTYVLTPATTLNFNVEAGVTNDAPDVHLMLRIPFQLGHVF